MVFTNLALTRHDALGTHAELLESSPIYREIYESQLGNGAYLADSSNGDGETPT